MYRPELSKSEEPQLALELINAYPLGLLISPTTNGILADYLPFIVKTEKTTAKSQSEIFLYTHVAKANPHCRHLPGEILHQSVDFFEASNGTNWSYNLPRQFKEELQAAIVGIKVKVNRLEGKFKLSQNRAQADYQAVLDFLRVSARQMDQDVYQWMLKTQSQFPVACE